jgi:hypothetical protein
MRLSACLPAALSVLSLSSPVLATTERDCWRFLLSLFNDFDGGATLDGLVSPTDIRNGAYRLPPDCESQLLNNFGRVDTARGGRADGLISPADIQTYIAGRP